VEPTVARGEMNTANLVASGKTLMLKRFHSNILAAHCWPFSWQMEEKHSRSIARNMNSTTTKLANSLKTV